MGGGAELAADAPWSFACPDWVERLKTGRALIPDLPLNRTEGDRAVAIFNKLRLPDVPGQPTMAEGAGEWFRDIIRAAFGSIEPESGRRRVGEVLALVPKKNSKTTGSAGIALTALLMNERPRAEMLLVGPTQEIADLAFQQAAGMIDADPEGYLPKRFQVQEHLKTIVDRKTKAKLKIKTFDMKVMTGSKPSFVLLDELHIMSTYSYASRVLGQIRGGLQPNAESLLVIISTQSDMPPAGVFKAELQYARGVRDGRITDRVRMLPVLYEFPEEMQRAKDKPWLDPANWPMVLPNLGRSVHIDRLLDDFAQANEKGEEEIRRWASQHLNVEIGVGLHTDRWAGADYWLTSEDVTLTLDELLARSEVVVAGIDGGGLDDLLGFTVIGRERMLSRWRDSKGREQAGKRWLSWSRAWAQSDVFERRKDIVERLRDFQKQGDLVECESPTQDIEDLTELVTKIAETGLFPEAGAIGFDPAGVSAIIDAFAEAQITPEQMVGIPQGYRLSGAVWGSERKLKDGTCVHAAQDLMNWCVGNAKAEQRGNAVLITKETAGKAKIDPLMAFFDAFTLMSRNPEGVGPSVYEDRGLLEIEFYG